MTTSIRTRRRDDASPMACLLSFLILFANTIFFSLSPTAAAWMTTTLSSTHQVRRTTKTLPITTTTTIFGEATNNNKDQAAKGLQQSRKSQMKLSNDEIKRYSRHLVLEDVGMVGQERLKASNVLVVGAGGLGSPCLMYLAAAGVGTIGIVDGDTVDESNLQRQIIHSTQTIGLSKCASAEQTLKGVNPHITIKTFEEEFTSDTAMRILQDEQWDIVVDGSDNFPTKYLINDACELLGIPWVYSAIQAFEGQLSTFNVLGDDGSRSTTTSYRDLLPSPPDPGVVPSCAEGGVVGVLPGTMGCLQATEVIKYLLGGPGVDLCTGRVMIFNAMKMTFSQVQLNRDPTRQPITELIDYQGFCAGPKKKTTIASTNQQDQQGGSLLPDTAVPPLANGHEQNQQKQQGRTMDEAEQVTVVIDNNDASFHSISPKTCLNKLRSGWSPYVLDVRLKTEHEICSLPFTDQVIPHRQIDVTTKIPKSGDVLIYCKAGARGKKACMSLLESGKITPDRLYNLEGGILQWQKDVDPSMPRY